MIVFLWLCNIL